MSAHEAEDGDPTAQKNSRNLTNELMETRNFAQDQRDRHARKNSDDRTIENANLIASSST